MKVKVLQPFVLGPEKIATVGEEVDLPAGLAQIAINDGSAEAVEQTAPAKHELGPHTREQIEQRDPQVHEREPKPRPGHK